jgi:hypothetical protein
VLEFNSGIELVEVTGMGNMKSAVHEPEIGIDWPCGNCGYGEFVTVIVPVKFPLPTEEV